MTLTSIEISTVLLVSCVLFSLLFSLLAAIAALVAVLKILAFEKSTHRIQFKPIAPQLQSTNTDIFKNMMNPSDEEFDYDAPLTKDL
jgi:hypothetical protein